MKVLIVLTYYRPHVSGLTIYVQRLAAALAHRGHQVTVLTSRYDGTLPEEETIEGVRVVRVPVLFRVSKGVIMPSFPWRAWRLIRRHDVVSIHLPQFEASLLALLARLARRPAVLTYHCDLQLPQGRFNRIVDRVVFFSNYLAGQLAQGAVAYTEDFARHSPFLSRFLQKVRVIPPPVIMPAPDPEAVEAFRARHDLGTGAQRRPVVGMAARLATEKGVEVLIGALPHLLEEFPDLKVLFAGQYQDVMGEEAYYERLMPMIEALGDDAAGAHWEFLGVLSQEEMPPFFAACDVLVVPSLNSTESFGLVQVEAMLCGTPSIASNLPGVRQPPRMTGMGEVTPIGDSTALAGAIRRILRDPARYSRPRRAIEEAFSLDRTVAGYEDLFDSLVNDRAWEGLAEPQEPNP
ncbi:MAG TPA: glycosyltransferase family 4 protein [Anaerolineae bacterium]|nr:glycosyltransferase family 4 protein [Anaerolineae bacterium]